MSNKEIRERKELQNLFADPKYSRQAWKAVGSAILMNPCSTPIETYDKDGNETMNSRIERYSFNKLSEDIKELGKENRRPTEIEMIMQCQLIKARTDTSAAIFVRDTLGAKPVDESKIDAQVGNPYEKLTDEELELVVEHRRKQAELEAAKSASEPAGDPPQPHIVVEEVKSDDR